MPEDPAAAASVAVQNSLEWIKIQTNTAIYLKSMIAELDRFNGDVGELHHFLKRGDQITAIIDRRLMAGTVDAVDAVEIKASLVGRVKRTILNDIQADEFTPWNDIKKKLKRVYGGGRWSPEEDMYSLLTLRKGYQQSDGQFAEEMILRYNRISDKLSEQYERSEATARITFLATILKVQLEKNLKNRNPLPADCSFIQAAQEVMDRGAREEEERYRCRSEEAWVRVERRRREERPRAQARNREPERRDPGRTQDRRFNRADYKRESGVTRQRERKCYECGRTGHLAAQCSKAKCFECGRRGHLARECPWMYRRGRDEPERMEVNFQKLQRRGRTSPTYSYDSEGASSSVSTSSTVRSLKQKKKRGAWSRDATPREETAEPRLQA